MELLLYLKISKFELVICKNTRKAENQNRLKRNWSLNSYPDVKTLMEATLEIAIHKKTNM